MHQGDKKITMSFQKTGPLVQTSKPSRLCLRPSSLKRESYIKDIERESVLHQCPGQGQNSDTNAEGHFFYLPQQMFLRDINVSGKEGMLLMPVTVS